MFVFDCVKVVHMTTNNEQQMKEETNLSIWLVIPRGKDSRHAVPFLAGDMCEVRTKAVDLGGKRYRCVVRIGPDNRFHGLYAKKLGL